MTEVNRPTKTKSWIEDLDVIPLQIDYPEKSEDDSHSDSISIISGSSVYETMGEIDDDDNELFMNAVDKGCEPRNPHLRNYRTRYNRNVSNWTPLTFSITAITVILILSILIQSFANIYMKPQRNKDDVSPAHEEDNKLTGNSGEFVVPIDDNKNLNDDILKQFDKRNIDNNLNDNNGNYKLEQLKAKEAYLLEKERFLIEKEHELIKEQMNLKSEKEYFEKQREESKQNKNKMKDPKNKKQKFKKDKTTETEQPTKGEPYEKHHKNYNKNDKTSKYDRQSDGKSKVQLTGDWYIKMNKGRASIRRKEQTSGWFLEVTHNPNIKRNKAHWYFQWMLQRERNRSKSF